MVEKPLEMSPDLQKFWGKKRKNQPFLREKKWVRVSELGPHTPSKIIWVRATSMCSKIGLLVIWMTAYKNQIWYINGWIFQSSPKLEGKLA